MPTLKEQMQERMDSRPDKHTLAWWNEQFTEVAKGYRGINHAVNLVLAEIEDRDSAVKHLQEQADALIQDICDANARIGKLQSEVTALQESMDKARNAYSELKKKGSVAPR